SHGASIEARNANQRTPIFLAAHAGAVRALNQLIRMGAEVDARDSGRFTPLHSAILARQVEAVSILLDAGADVSLQSHLGSDAAAIAASVGEPSIIELVLGQQSSAVTDAGALGKALFNAVQMNNIEAIRQLLSENADPHFRNEWGFTMWHAASSAEAAELLVPLDIDLDALDIGGSTALAIHSMAGNTDVALLLIENGADVNISNALGLPLHSAIKNNLPELAAALIEAGSDLTKPDADGSTPSELAEALGSSEMMALFR
ncbi:MAG: ankyrin repeat domain-containing protein, partial [Wenzhouxiangella sp.]|nr:ankyrin repeat domain-containing protein [Wenzhouxiangella sp.]